MEFFGEYESSSPSTALGTGVAPPWKGRILERLEFGIQVSVRKTEFKILRQTEQRFYFRDLNIRGSRIDDNGSRTRCPNLGVLQLLIAQIIVENGNIERT
jgi:hypothetical protein